MLEQARELDPVRVQALALGQVLVLVPDQAQGLELESVPDRA